LNADSLGDDTSGTWELFLDGESIGLADTFDENISALWVNADRSFHLNVNRNLTLDNQLSGDGQDIFTCDTTPACRDALLFDGSTVGINRGTIDAFAIGDEGVMGDIGGEPSEDGAQVFLPLVVR
jgi:hypothetical protein